MSDGTRIRFGLPRTASLMPADLPPTGAHVNLSAVDHSNHPSAIGDIDGSTLTLDVPPEGIDVLKCDVGDALGVGWSLRGMMCRMRVIRIEDAPGTSVREFTVRVDDGPYAIERREFFRVACTQNVIIRRADGDWRARTHDMSRSGALIFASHPLAVDEEIDITIELHERFGPLTCRARVVRRATEHEDTAYGIQFISLPHADDERLVKFITWQQLHG